MVGGLEHLSTILFPPDGDGSSGEGKRGVYDLCVPSLDPSLVARHYGKPSTEFCPRDPGSLVLTQPRPSEAPIAGP